jgi:lipopolysaccharide export system protein LptC
MSSLTSTAAGLTRVQLSRTVTAAALCLAAGLAGVFVYQAGLFQTLAPRPVEPGLQTPLAGQTTVSGSRATGFDREHQPYDVTASAARQDEKEPDRVHLQSITGTFRRASGEILRLTANTALYNTSVKELDLEGDVTLVSEGRFTAHMARAHVVVADKTLTSGAPVSVDLESGHVDANGVTITNDGKNILFSNGVRATFKAKGQQGDGTP